MNILLAVAAQRMLFINEYKKKTQSAVYFEKMLPLLPDQQLVYSFLTDSMTKMCSSDLTVTII